MLWIILTCTRNSSLEHIGLTNPPQWDKICLPPKQPKHICYVFFSAWKLLGIRYVENFRLTLRKRMTNPFTCKYLRIDNQESRAGIASIVHTVSPILYIRNNMFGRRATTTWQSQQQPVNNWCTQWTLRRALNELNCGRTINCTCIAHFRFDDFMPRTIYKADCNSSEIREVWHTWMPSHHESTSQVSRAHCEWGKEQ